MKFKLLSQHYIDDVLLEAGTVIGEGTSVPFLDASGKMMLPSIEMEGLDPEAEKLVEERKKSYMVVDNRKAAPIITPETPIFGTRGPGMDSKIAGKK